MLDRLGDELFGDSVAPAAVLHTELAHEIESENGTATLRITGAVRRARATSG